MNFTNIPDSLKKDSISLEDIKKYLDSDKIKEQIKTINQAIRQDKLTVLFLGATGCGKSSLINRIFKYDLTSVSDTRSETQGFKEITHKNKPDLRLFDSRGYEIGQIGRLFHDIDSFLKDKVNSHQFPDLIIYCLDISKKRIEQTDGEIIKNLEEAYKIPIIIFLTKLDNDSKGLPIAHSYIDELAKQEVKKDIIFKTTKIPKFKNYDELDKGIQYAFDHLKELEDKKIQSQQAVSSHAAQYSQDDTLEDIIKKTKTSKFAQFGTSVDPSLLSEEQLAEAQKSKVSTIIHIHVALAAAVALTPIPFSDAVAIVPIQINMTRKIFNIYKMDSTNSIIMTVIPELVLASIGKSIAGNLLKFIPVIGTITGAAINTAVATGITYGLGFGLQKFCETYAGDDFSTAEEVRTAFKESGIMDSIRQSIKEAKQKK